MEALMHRRRLHGDEIEALRLLENRPRSLLTLHERLGLSGTTGEMRALCAAVDGLEGAGLIEVAPSEGFSSWRWRITEAGRSALPESKP